MRIRQHQTCSFMSGRPTDLLPPVEVELARSTERFPGLEVIEQGEENIVYHDDDAHDLAKDGAGSVVPVGQSKCEQSMLPS